MQPYADDISQMDPQDFRNPASPVRYKTTAHQRLAAFHPWLSRESVDLFDENDDATSN